MNISRIFAAAFASLAMLTAGGAAFAQKNGILFLDQQRVISESTAGKSIDRQLREITEQVAREIGPEQAKIDEETNQLRDTRESLSEEDFNLRYQSLLARAQRLEQFKQLRRTELEQARTKAISDLAKAWEPIAEEIFKKKKGYVLLEKQAVLIASDKGDITDEVIAALNKKLTTVAVVKPDLQAQMLAAAQAKQQQQQAAQTQQQQQTQ
ncbi:OmpH family outer membrane protein [Parvularcula lutaonensis]|uniref:OmpH family outer membrane protein n=1 Tax=Parvularcula lutaonensis TaxID=491923 RepID=A0ABV7MEB7_9PROT|nr:OmpH family outer membrane protein [Parvularcula lutaonensis]